ncbi:MAG: hypothetical protein WCN87_01695 [Chlamydiota bacterium]
MISLSFLLDPSDFKELMSSLGVFFVRIDKVEEEPIMSLEALVAAYEIYWEKLLKKEKMEPSFLKRNFQLALVTHLDAINFLPIKIAKVKEPVVMMRPRPDRGLEVLYPRIFQEAGTGLIHKTFPPGKFSNTDLFQRIQRFLRKHTLPQKESPLRLGLNITP